VKTHRQIRGFTLIEVLLALAVIAIALTALLKASSQDVYNTQRIKDKTLNHWVAMQAVNMIQTGLLKPATNQDISQVTLIFGQRWYWQAKLSSTGIKSMDRITINISEDQTGPFRTVLTAFRYKP